jgi:endonuclease YncB( thermonuclease family)
MTALPRARLAGYREQSGAIRFRIASSPDLQETVEELKRRVPSWARRYDSRTREWSVNADYRTVLEALFVNTPSAIEPVGGGRGRGRDPFGTEAQYTSRARTLWFVLVLAAIVAAGALLWSRTPRPALPSTQAQTSIAQTQQAAPAPAPVSAPQQGRINSVANLRAAPGTDSVVLRKAAAGETVTAVGKHRANDNYWWLLLEGGSWVRSDLVVRLEEGGLPLDLSTLPELDAGGRPVPQRIEATAAPSADPGTAGASVAAVAEGPVLFVVDGDTIHVNLEGREVRVRYIGIDTPERDEPGYGSASDANRALVEGRTVRLVADREDMDGYGRLLRYVYVDHDADAATPDLFVNRALVEQGWADLLTIAPNTAHAAELGAAHSQAQAGGVGLWD